MALIEIYSFSVTSQIEFQRDILCVDIELCMCVCNEELVALVCATCGGRRMMICVLMA
jgi:hypothetical protein